MTRQWHRIIGLVVTSGLILPAFHTLMAGDAVFRINRQFKPVEINMSTPSVYNIITEADKLTEIVGPFPVVTNSASAVEYEGVSWGQQSSVIAWSNVVRSLYPITIGTYGEIFDDPGWIKGRKSAYNTDGAYLWILQNRLNFTTSRGTTYSAGAEETVYSIDMVYVGTIGDYAPAQTVNLVWPEMNVTNPVPCPSLTSDMSYESETVKFSQNLMAYYKLGDVQASDDIPEFDLVPDFNHDRKIDDNDRCKATDESPFRFWINGDADKGDVASGTSDLPGHWGGYFGAANYSYGHVCGRSDLEDFFPVWLDMHEILNAMPVSSGYKYWLSQENGAVKAVYTDLTRENAGDYLTTEGASYGSSFNENSYEAKKFNITSSGVVLNSQFLDKIKTDAGKGILLIEGAGLTTAPLVLSVWKDGQILKKKKIPLSISSVTDMYRWMNLRHVAGGKEKKPTNTGEPKNNPDAESGNKHIVYIHGFNESEAAGVANICETFKRLYWSGSKAKFTGVAWNGNASTPESTHYHYDVTNAFVTARAFACYVIDLHDIQGEEVNVIAFSLGNMVVSSAIQDWCADVDRYFMLHAAVAQEAYDASAYTSDMIQADWRNYSSHLYASEWYRLWNSVPNDGRYSLTWRGRFSNIAGSQVYNFYSSGENILRNYGPGVSITKELFSQIWQFDFGEYSWSVQELWKGRAFDWLGGSTYGGWGFNLADYGEQVRQSDGSYWTEPWPPDRADTIFPLDLRTKPFFCKGAAWLNPLYREPDVTNGVGSTFARDYGVRSVLLAEMIPALSFAAGANEVSSFAGPSGNRNINMQGQYSSGIGFQNGWPAERNQSRWLHGDFRKVAYTYVYKLFDKISKEIGGFDK